LLDATVRLAEQRPVIEPTRDDGSPLVFALQKGDLIELDIPGAERAVCVVRSFSDTGGFDLMLSRHNDAAEKTVLQKLGRWVRITSASALLRSRPLPVDVTPLGEIVRRNGRTNP
jgi:hypothetical protein